MNKIRNDIGKVVDEFEQVWSKINTTLNSNWSAQIIPSLSAVFDRNISMEILNGIEVNLTQVFLSCGRDIPTGFLEDIVQFRQEFEANVLKYTQKVREIVGRNINMSIQQAGGPGTQAGLFKCGSFRLFETNRRQPNRRKKGRCKTPQNFLLATLASHMN